MRARVFALSYCTDGTESRLTDSEPSLSRTSYRPISRFTLFYHCGDGRSYTSVLPLSKSGTIHGGLQSLFDDSPCGALHPQGVCTRTVFIIGVRHDQSLSAPMSQLLVFRNEKSR